MLIMHLAHRFAFSPLFFFNDTATTEIYTLSLHDALPISSGMSMPQTMRSSVVLPQPEGPSRLTNSPASTFRSMPRRSEEHTSELQSQSNLVCRLLLEKKKKKEEKRDEKEHT